MNGLVLGKYMPVHKGHLALIDFALENCNSLTILLCYHKAEPIPHEIRQAWLQELFAGNERILVDTLEYDPALLSDSSHSSVENAKPWALILKKLYPHIDIIFSSENYGEIVARFMNITFLNFDIPRNRYPIAASDIRAKPFRYWDFIPKIAQPYFVKKICLVGSESTGKSTLTEKLAAMFSTEFVPETARQIVAHSDECTMEQLLSIAASHAKSIEKKCIDANKVLFMDTDITITKSYASFLFGKELLVPDWVEESNQACLYLFLETDAPYIQDGTRLSKLKRDQLSASHKREFKKSGISYVSISGTWEQRTEKALILINEWLSKF